MRTYRCKNCKTKNPSEWEIILHWVIRVCSKQCRLDLLNEKKRKEKEKIKIRKEKKREKKRNSASVLIRKADTLFSRYIRLRDSLKTTWNYERCKCITCDNIYDYWEIQNWHFASRRFYQTRWLEKNCNAQCYMCNVWLWWEQYKHGKAIDEMYWEWTAEKIMQMAKRMEKLDKEEIKQTIENIQIKLKEYE